MTAAEASIVVQDKEGEKKDAQKTDASEEKKPVTGPEAGDEQKISDNKSEKSAKDSETIEKEVREPTVESEVEDKDKVKPKAEDAATTKTESSKTDEATPADEADGKKEDDPDNAKTKTNESEDPAVEAKLCLIQGKRNMLVQDYAMAVESLQRACELLAAKFGDDASECAEALHYYGKALLELHRKESGALNEMDNQEAAEDDSSDENEEQGNEEEEEKEAGKDNEKSQAGDGSSGEEKADDDAVDQTAAKDEEDLEGEPDANAPEKEAQEALGYDEDVSNLQIAFEVLELAKKIYKRDAEKDTQLYLKAADCLLSLGEINLESDTYDRAIDDFEGCLRIQQEMLPRDARALAETNYQLGLTYSFVNKYEQSAAYFGDALQILDLKVSNLKKIIEEEKAKNTKPAEGEEDTIKCAEEEIDEIQQLLPEIVAKMEDAKEMQKDNAQGDKEKIISQMMNRVPEVSPVKTAKANVISSSLIKRKRPADEAETSSSSSTDQAEKRLKEN